MFLENGLGDRSVLVVDESTCRLSRIVASIKSIKPNATISLASTEPAALDLSSKNSGADIDKEFSL